jgi:cyclophilin family peptidyl-prolyl cis-trans isomerase
MKISQGWKKRVPKTVMVFVTLVLPAVFTGCRYFDGAM